MKISKTLSAVLCAAALLAFTTACGDTETEWVTAPTISSAEAVLTAPDSGGTLTLGFTVSNPVSGGTITTSLSASWVTVTSCTETAAVLSVSENPNGEPRTARVTVTYSYTIGGSKGSCSCEATVAQSCGDQPAISVQPTAVAVAIEGGDYSFNYTIVNPASDGQVSASCTSSWISGIDTSKDGVVGFSASENTSGLRQTTITLSYTYSGGTLSDTVTVVQDHATGSEDGGSFDGDIEGTYTITGVSYESYPSTNSWTVTIHYNPNSPYTDSENPYLIDGLFYSNVGDYTNYTSYCAKARVEDGNIIVPAQITQGVYYLDGATKQVPAYLSYVAGYMDSTGYLYPYDNYPDIVFTYSSARDSWTCDCDFVGLLYDTYGDFNSYSGYFTNFTFGNATLVKGSGSGGGGGGGYDDGSFVGTYLAHGKVVGQTFTEVTETTWTLRLYSYVGNASGYDYYVDGLLPWMEDSYSSYLWSCCAGAYVNSSGDLVIPVQVLNMQVKTNGVSYYLGVLACYQANNYSPVVATEDIVLTYDGTNWNGNYGPAFGAFATTDTSSYANIAYQFADSDGFYITKLSDDTSYTPNGVSANTPTTSLDDVVGNFKTTTAPASEDHLKARNAGVRSER